MNLRICCCFCVLLCFGSMIAATTIPAQASLKVVDSSKLEEFEKDCAGVIGGKSFIVCGFCIKPSENASRYGMDCRGTCLGTYHIIANGSCIDSYTPEMRARDEARRNQEYIDYENYKAKRFRDGLTRVFFPMLWINRRY